MADEPKIEYQDNPDEIEKLKKRMDDIEMSLGVFNPRNLAGLRTKDLQQATRANLFGDGSDGDVVISTEINLERDMFYNNLTVESGGIINTKSFRIFVKDQFIKKSGGILRNNGNDGGDGGNCGSGSALAGGGGGGAGGSGGVIILIYGEKTGTGTLSVAGGQGGAGGISGDSVTPGSGAGGNGGAAVPSGSLPGGVAGSKGGGPSYNSVKGDDGIDVEKSLGSAGSGGGGGGSAGGGHQGGAGGNGGDQTGTLYNFPNSYLSAYQLIDTQPTISCLSLSAGSGGGGNGGSDTDVYGAGGGGSGSPGGMIWIAANRMFIEGTGEIQCNGGNGGKGGDGKNANNGANGSAGQTGKIYEIKI